MWIDDFDDDAETGDITSAALNTLCTTGSMTISCAGTTQDTVYAGGAFSAVVLCSSVDYKTSSFEITNGNAEDTLSCFEDLDYIHNDNPRYCSMCNYDGKSISSVSSTASTVSMTGFQIPHHEGLNMADNTLGALFDYTGSLRRVTDISQISLTTWPENLITLNPKDYSLPRGVHSQRL